MIPGIQGHDKRLEPPSEFEHFEDCDATWNPEADCLCSEIAKTVEMDAKEERCGK